MSDGGVPPSALPPLPPSIPGVTQPSRTQSQSLVDNNSLDVSQFIKDESDLCFLIARIGCAFNPIHDALATPTLQRNFRNLPPPPPMPLP